VASRGKSVARFTSSGLLLVVAPVAAPVSIDKSRAPRNAGSSSRLAIAAVAVPPFRSASESSRSRASSSWA